MVRMPAHIYSALFIAALMLGAAAPASDAISPDNWPKAEATLKVETDNMEVIEQTIADQHKAGCVSEDDYRQFEVLRGEFVAKSASLHDSHSYAESGGINAMFKERINPLVRSISKKLKTCGAPQ